jgi:hypothetical protein
MFRIRPLVTICLKISYCLPGGFAAIQGQQLHLSTHRYGVVGLLENTQTNIEITTIESLTSFRG